MTCHSIPDHVHTQIVSRRIYGQRWYLVGIQSIISQSEEVEWDEGKMRTESGTSFALHRSPSRASLSSFSNASTSSLSSDSTRPISTRWKSSSSLQLQSFSSESCPSSYRLKLQRKGSHPSDDQGEKHSIARFYDFLQNTDTLLFILLLAVISQLPLYVQEIREITEFHYHSLCSLIVLAQIFHRQQRSSMVCAKASSALRRTPSLTAIEEFYQRDPVYPATSASTLQVMQEDQSEEWGHFADFDDDNCPWSSTSYSDVSSSSSTGSSSKAILERIAEEDQCD